tara:strand:+ start:66 stop:179 length:114 start_codon:yes stop_codon:yes gene_type:complete
VFYKDKKLPRKVLTLIAKKEVLLKELEKVEKKLNELL